MKGDLLKHHCLGIVHSLFAMCKGHDFTHPNAALFYMISRISFKMITQTLYSCLKKYVPNTLQGTNISPQNGILKMIFLFPRWDMLVPWRVYLLKIPHSWSTLSMSWTLWRQWRGVSSLPVPGHCWGHCWGYWRWCQTGTWQADRERCGHHGNLRVPPQSHPPKK